MTLKEIALKLENTDDYVSALDIEFDKDNIEELVILSAIVMEYGPRLTLPSEVWVAVKKYYREERPARLEQIKDFSKTIMSTLKDVIGGKGAIVSTKEAARRMKICYSCPAYDDKSNRCNSCGCSLEYTSLLKNKKCPKDKWSKSNDDR